MKRRTRKRLQAALGAAAAAAILAWVIVGTRDGAPIARSSPTPATVASTEPDDANPAESRAPELAADLPPLPSVARTARPWHVVRAAYEFAARRPDVLQYVPCFCGCERHRHRSNHDCFVAARDGARVLKWDTHALT